MKINQKIWLECLDTLSENLTEREMRLWIKPLTVKHDNEGIELYAPNKFMKEEVEKNFLEKIRQVLSQIVSDVPVSLKINTVEQAENKTVNVPNGFKTNLNTEMTFDSFVEGKSNQLAKAACHSVVNEPGVFNPLYIYGGVGLGKTHLMHAIGNNALEKFPSLKIVNITSEQFTLDFVNSLRKNKFLQI